MDLRINRRQVLLIALDLCLVAVSAYFALLLQFNFRIATPYLLELKEQIFSIVGICLTVI